VGRKATYLFIETIIGMVAGYVLWLFLSGLTTPDVIGIASTVISLSYIFSQIIDLAIPVGNNRFLGRSFSERDAEYTQVLVKGSLLLVCSSILVGSVLILVFKQWFAPAIGFDLTIILVLIIGITVIVELLRSIFIAALKTKSLPKIMVISSLVRIVLAITLVLFGTGAAGITIGYLIGYAVAMILLSFTLVTLLNPIKGRSSIPLFQVCKSILVASIPSWIPRVMAVVGSHLGTVVVFGAFGPSQAGSYFIAMAIFYAIDAVRNSLFSVAFPILSAMDDQRKRLVWRIIKMSLVVSLPLSFTAMVYSNEALGLIGPSYVQASMPLKILLLSIFPLTLLAGISYLVYSYGNYWQVLAIGLGLNIPRILLYFTLVPTYGSVGAAIAFTAGSIIGFIVSVIVAKRIGMMIFWKELALIFVIPTGIAFTLDYFHIIYILGIPAMLSLSILLMLASRVLSKSEVRESLDILPDRIGKPIIKILNKL
jgi:O-antigen/teichoic acid export membrane protein